MQEKGVGGREGIRRPIKQYSTLQPQPASTGTCLIAWYAVEDAVTLKSSSGAGPSVRLAAGRAGAGPVWDPLALPDPVWLRLPRPALPLPEEPCLLLEGAGDLAALEGSCKGIEHSFRDAVHAAATAAI